MIYLTAIEPEDLDVLYTIENDTELWNIGCTNVPYSRYSLRDYILTQQNDIYADKQLRQAIRLTPQGEAIGLIDLFNFSPDHSRAEIGIIIRREFQDKGYATDAVQQIKHYAHTILHLHQVYCIVPIDNEASLALFRHCGFTNETVLHDWVRTTAGWKDAITLQYILTH